jgi:hypothetical protein
MDVQIQLERIRRRVQLCAVELQLQPETFQATQELRIASGELTSVIEEIVHSSRDTPGRRHAEIRVTAYSDPPVADEDAAPPGDGLPREQIRAYSRNHAVV